PTTTGPRRVTPQRRRYGIATPKDRRADRHRARLHGNLVRICAECGELILRSGPGRPPIYCSDRCRVAAWWRRQAENDPANSPRGTTMQNGGDTTQHNPALTATEALWRCSAPTW